VICQPLLFPPARIGQEEERGEGVAALHRVGPREDDDDDDPGTGGGNDGTGGGDGSQPMGEGGTGNKNNDATATMMEIEEAEDVTTTGNKIFVTPAAEAVMDAITTRVDADDPSAVMVMLLEEDYEEGDEDNDVTDKVMRELWRDDKDKDKDKDDDEDDRIKVEGEDGDGGVIDDNDNDGNDDGGGGSDQGGGVEGGGVAQPRGPPLRKRVKLRRHRGGKGQTAQTPCGEGHGGQRVLCRARWPRGGAGGRKGGAPAVEGGGCGGGGCRRILRARKALGDVG